LDALKSFFYLVAGFPIFVFGFLNNFLPFRIPFWSAKLITKRPDFFGSISLTMGTFTFLIFYSLQIWLVNSYLHDWRITLAYALFLPVSGLFSFYYFKRFTNLRGKWMIFTLFYKKSSLVASLISRRTHIIDELKKGKEDFIKHNNPIEAS